MAQQNARQQYQNMVNNAQGHAFEDCIKAGCLIYQERGLAEIDQTPEPFRVIKKHADGIFTGRFIARAQPDFSGTLLGGRSICFEAKYTTTDQMKRSVLTETQMKRLEAHMKSGAVAGVCIGIKEKYYFIPWAVWRDMKTLYGRQYITADDVEEYRVKFNGAVLFLDYINAKKSLNIFKRSIVYGGS